jgi:hypothetical protein
VKELGYLGPAIRDHEHFSGAAQVEQWIVNPQIAPETAYFRVVHHSPTIGLCGLNEHLEVDLFAKKFGRNEL